jgi:hypothetical protein
MDWFLLIFLVPLIIVPIVLLLGFAGCRLDTVGQLTCPPPPSRNPTIPAAKAGGTRLVRLSWQDNAGGTAKFSISRGKVGGRPSEIRKDWPRTTFDDDFRDLPPSAATEGTTFVYYIAATKLYCYPSTEFTISTTTFPEAPKNLVATAIDDRQIDLTWDDTPNKADRFIIEHRTPPAGFAALNITVGGTPTGGLLAHHMGLTPGTTHEYRVKAVVHGFDDNVKKDVESDWSTASATTKAWKTAFGPVTFDADQGNWANGCMVQRINAAGNLLAGGNPVRITLRSATGAALNIKRAFISQTAPPGGAAGEPWDPASDLAQVKFGGNEGTTLPAGTSVLSDPTNYTLDPAKDLLIAFDIGPQGGARRGPKPGCQAYRSSGTAPAPSEQAKRPDRSGFTPAGQPANMVYFVEKIEVFS